MIRLIAFSSYESEADKIREYVEKLRSTVKEECRVNKEKYDPRDVKNLDHGYMSLVSYLESCNWQVDDAAKSMTKHSIWRKENKYFDLKATDIPREVHEMNIYHPFGFDKFGHPLLVIRTSRCAFPKEAYSIVMKQFIWAAEQLRSKVINYDHKLALVFDCRNVQINLGFLREVLTLYTTEYPLSVAYILFIDMNFSFKIFYQVIKHFFPKYLRDHMFLASSSQLDQLIDEDNLPDFLGGKLSVLDQKWLCDCVSLEKYVSMHNLPKNLVQKMADYHAKNRPQTSYMANNNESP